MLILSILTAAIVLALVGVTVYLLCHIKDLADEETHRRAAPKDTKIPQPRLPESGRDRDYTEKYFAKRKLRESDSPRNN